MVPRLINYLNIMETGGATRAFCGSMFSVVIGLHNNPYFFGKNKVRTDGQLHPKVVDDLCGMRSGMLLEWYSAFNCIYFNRF